MNRFKLAYYVLRYLGPSFVALRSLLGARQFIGANRRCYPNRDWNELDLAGLLRSDVPSHETAYHEWKLSNPPRFIFPLGEPPKVQLVSTDPPATRQPTLKERMELLGRDRCVYFCKYPSPVPIQWHRNPFDDCQSDPRTSWYEIPDYLPRQGDPRMLWEPARAAWAIDCAKASAAGMGDQAGRNYWRWVDSFMSACPPYRGFQWKCGQESAVRLMALLIGFWAVAKDSVTTSDRYTQIARFAWATGHRIRYHINYAISQKNNHALSESCGLILIGALFPELRASRPWMAHGLRVLSSEIRRQSYSDGSYVQQSMNYHRVMLQVCLFALRLGELAEKPFSHDIYEIFGRSVRFLHDMMDEETGRVPLYGNNDGAYVLPWSECDFVDFRPVVQSGYYLVERRRVLPPGPWDEDLVWLFGESAMESAVSPTTKTNSSKFNAGGYYRLNQENSWMMTRCHTYRDRPGHYDQMHVDLWWKGHNILRDCGTYRYYVPGRGDVEYYFKSIRAHNTVEIDGRNPIESASRFLWFPWPKGQLLGFHDGKNDGMKYVDIVSFDYWKRPSHCLHRRIIVSLCRDLWVIVDQLEGAGSHESTIRWHFPDVPAEINEQRQEVKLAIESDTYSCALRAGEKSADRFQIIRGRDTVDQVQGFESPYYGKRRPIPTLEATWRADLPLRIVSVFAPGVPPRVTLTDRSTEFDRWEIRCNDEVHQLRLARSHELTSPLLLDHRGRNAASIRRCKSISC